jgi:cbb3-type cytochrome oxidase subunit 3
MRLTDVMSNLGLGIYPILALPLFIGVFVAVVVRTNKRSKRAELDRAGGLPLEEGQLVRTQASDASQRQHASPADRVTSE